METRSFFIEPFLLLGSMVRTDDGIVVIFLKKPKIERFLEQFMCRDCRLFCVDTAKSVLRVVIDLILIVESKKPSGHLSLQKG